MVKRLVSCILSLCLLFLSVIDIGAAGTIETEVVNESNVAAPAYIYGDADNNGSVDSSDALLVLKASVGISSLEGKGFVKGDVNCDSNISSDDALLILKKSVGIISEFPVEEMSEDDMNERIKNYVSKEKSELLQLVNPANPLPSDYDPNISTLKKGKKFATIGAKKLDEMIDACNAVYGSGKLWAQSTYRDYNTQKKLYENEVTRWKNKGYSDKNARIKAATIVAAPGTSEHNSGLACDFNTITEAFANTKMYSWLLKNCTSYGFIERYPNDKQDITGIIWEPWHYRYIGVEVAKEMEAYDWCLEEYHYYNHM